MGLQFDFKQRRVAMVRDQLRARGIENQQVLEAMEAVPRHLFVDEALQAQAYTDNALPIGFGQTISQPYIVARMVAALRVEPGSKVLEIGTGSGYQAAVLAELGAEVYSVERIKPLYNLALKRLNNLRYFKVKVNYSDGTYGLPEQAPFDRIVVTAGGPEIPYPLLNQLSESGILLLPLDAKQNGQRLVRLLEQNGKWYKQDLGPANFVDLKGAYGWE